MAVAFSTKLLEHFLSTRQFGNSCFQATTLVPAPTEESEDCLTINVWTGSLTPQERRPVMVWLNPGGFQFGSSADPTYNGTLLAHHGVVVVSFNYRLGVLGFLAHPELDAEGRFSGNFGLQDMLLALTWVQNNVAIFGGDPSNVTLFGESAGAHATGLLMSSPLAKGLFHKAIMQSGSWWDTTHGSLTTFTEARVRGTDYLEKLQVTSIAEARTLSGTVANQAGLWDESHDPALAAYSPDIDDYVLKENPGTVFLNGKQMDIPLLVGWNEAEYYAFQPQEFNTDHFQNEFAQLFGTLTDEGLHFYPENTSALLQQSNEQLTGDLLIAEETWEAAYWQNRLGNHQKVFAYYFTYTSPFCPIATHTADLAFMFGNLLPNPVFGNMSRPADSQDKAFSKALMTYWTNFAISGDPNKGENATNLPHWPQFKQSSNDTACEILELGTTIRSAFYDVSRFQFLRSFRKDGVRPYSWRLVNP